MNLPDAFARAVAPHAALVLLCCRCRTLRAPGPDLGRALCRRCQDEMRDLFRDDHDGLVALEGDA